MDPSFRTRERIIKFKVSSIGTYRTMGPQDSAGTIRNDYNVRTTIMNKGSISVVLNIDKVMIIEINQLGWLLLWN